MPVSRAMWAAVAFGSVHALITVYWMLGGRWLVETLGARVLEQFGDRPLLLLPVALLKGLGVLLPVLWQQKAWPNPRLTRTLVWLGAVVLVLWGGANTVVGNLVLAGLVTPDGGFDRAAMVGHAWLWDPLFLAWGVALALALRGRTVRRT